LGSVEPTPLSSSAPFDPAPPKRRSRLRLLIGILAVVLSAGMVASGIHWWRGALVSAGPLPEAHTFLISRGATAQLAASLASDGVVDQPKLFQMAAWLTRAEGPLHAAEFAFPAHASIRQVLTILRTAQPVEHHLTIPEGLTARQITAVLAHADAMTGAVPAIAEGSVLPQTYDYLYGADRMGLIARAQAAMGKDLAAIWADRAADLPLSSPRDALILASIVERETARPEERPHVAAVYLNRLRQGMRLQADPTVVYLASNGAGVLDHRLTRAELQREDPFNTYRTQGLPPAPICSPSLDSLRAVLHPEASDDLFFVADGSGGHIFSRSYEAHDSAVTRWRALAPSTPRGNSD
jgi:UPF0755 protein